MCFTRFSAIFILFSPFPQGQNNGKVVPREPQTGEDVSWTGDGFVEIKDKATLEYAVTNVPYTGEYNILVRYEPKVWFFIGLDFCVRKRDVRQIGPPICRGKSCSVALYRIIERLSSDVKPKPKWLLKGQSEEDKYFKEPIRAQNKNKKTLQSAGKRGWLRHDCFFLFVCFESDWLKEWCEFSGPITHYNRAKLKQSGMSAGYLLFEQCK